MCKTFQVLGLFAMTRCPCLVQKINENDEGTSILVVYFADLNATFRYLSNFRLSGAEFERTTGPEVMSRQGAVFAVLSRK